MCACAVMRIIVLAGITVMEIISGIGEKWRGESPGLRTIGPVYLKRGIRKGSRRIETGESIWQDLNWRAQ